MKRASNERTRSLRLRSGAEPRPALLAPSDSPTRSEFQRDRDRIIHSTAFRRLQYKTQVFLHHEGQHFRTRLTHTLEVSQMARSIARALRLERGSGGGRRAGARSRPHAVRPCRRARAAREDGAPMAASTTTCRRSASSPGSRTATPSHDGLNLTWETLEGILKHNGPLIDDDDRPVGRYVDEWLPFGLDDIPASADLMLCELCQPRGAGRGHRRRHRLQRPRHRRRPARRPDHAATICAMCRWSARSSARCSTR